MFVGGCTAQSRRRRACCSVCVLGGGEGESLGERGGGVSGADQKGGGCSGLWQLAPQRGQLARCISVSERPCSSYCPLDVISPTNYNNS